MNHLEKVKQLRESINSVQTARKTINSLYGWKYWFVNVYEFREDKVPLMSNASDEEIVSIAREQILYDNTELLEELYDEEYATA